MGGHVTMRLVASQGSCAWVWCGVTVTRRLPGAQCPCVLVTRAANEPSRSFHCAWRRPLLGLLLVESAYKRLHNLEFIRTLC